MCQKVVKICRFAGFVAFKLAGFVARRLAG